MISSCLDINRRLFVVYFRIAQIYVMIFIPALPVSVKGILFFKIN